MIIRNLIIFILVISVHSINAQNQFTLQQCIDTALVNNIQVKEKYLLVQSAEVNWHQSRSNLLPSVSSSIYHGYSTGKNIDPSSNNYVTQNLNYANYQLISGVTIFNGGYLQNTIRQFANAYEAAKWEWQQSKDNLVLNVILAYLQVLSNEDLVNAAINQENVSEEAVKRAEVLNSQGAIKPSDFSDLKGQLMGDKLAIVTNKNALETSKLNLLQLMNRSYDRNMQVQHIDVEEFLTDYKKSSDEIYGSALQNFSQVRAVEARTKSFEYGVKSARGLYYPLLSLNGGFASNYSSTALNNAGKIPYNTQLVNNISSLVGVGITIPIFNHSQVRNQVKQAEILYKNNKLIEQDTKMQMHQLIDQAFLNMRNSYERYKILLEQVNAYSQSFKAAEIRFNAGVGTSIDYLTAKDRLDRANINLIDVKYDFVLRKKILDYYANVKY